MTVTSMDTRSSVFMAVNPGGGRGDGEGGKGEGRGRGGEGKGEEL